MNAAIWIFGSIAFVGYSMFLYYSGKIRGGIEVQAIYEKYLRGYCK